MKISLFSPHDVPGLYDAFGSPGFDDIYLPLADESVPRKDRWWAGVVPEPDA